MAAGAAMPALAATSRVQDDLANHSITAPKYLKSGDTIGITCPAGFISDKDIQAAVHQMQTWGFNIKVGDTVNRKDFSFGGTDHERTDDFQRMLNDSSVKAIMCARGGYGSIRIIDRLDFARFALEPKWIIGFSDVTVFHSHLNRQLHVASIHSKMCNSFPDDLSQAEPGQRDSILSIRRALIGETMEYRADPNPANQTGKAEGVLVGGNLKTLESLAGSKSDIETHGKILFLEDTNEYLYSIDRSFWNLARAGKLANLAGLIIGGFKTKPDEPGEEFGRTVCDIVLEKTQSYRYPICFDFPVGHQKNNYALKCGIKHRLNVQSEGSALVELKE